MPAKKNIVDPTKLSGAKLVKAVNAQIRKARKHWDAHRNQAARRERDKALDLYNRLTKPEKEGVPQQLRVWLRYRSEKYFGEQRTAPGNGRGQHSQAGDQADEPSAPEEESDTLWWEV